MKRINTQLFNELCKSSSFVATGWLITRVDGVQMGFTSADIEFTLDGVTYTPTNAFSGSAAVSKSNLSVDNMSATAVLNAALEEHDLLGGKYDNATVKVFWIRPDRPEWGTCPIRGGKIGEVTLKGITFEAELRSVAQQLQQQVGEVYTLECRVERLGNSQCKLKMEPETWSPGMCVFGRIAGEGGIGSVVEPLVYNGFWYVCDGAPLTVSSDEPLTSTKFTGTDGTKLKTKWTAMRALHGIV